MEQPFIEIEVAGKKAVRMELRAPISAPLKTALDVVDETVRKAYREKCVLDPARPWRDLGD